MSPLTFALLTCAVAVVLSETCPHPEDIAPSCFCGYEGSDSEIKVTCGGGDQEAALVHLQGKKVREVLFKNTRLGRVSSVFFWGLHIRKLHFDNCELESVADGYGKPAFLGLENSLEELTINYGFRGNQQLKSLNLIHLRNLKTLTLSANNISELPNDWFSKGPGSLTEIRLHDNSIRELGDRAFASLGGLRNLELSDNKLKTLRRTMFPRPARNLVELTLSKNSLSSLPQDMFMDMPSLKSVYLDSNKLQRLDSATWSRVWEQLEHLYLHENLLECDSHIEWTLAIKRPEELTGSCATPEDRKGIELKVFIDEGRNSTSEIESQNKPINLLALLHKG